MSVPPGQVDLHMHTTGSDGSLAPAALVAAALAAGLVTIAVTDHDTLGGLPAALQAARGTTLRVLPGVELAGFYQGYSLHLLGYGFDPANAALSARLTALVTDRVDRMHAMLGRLAEGGIYVSWAAVAAYAKGAVGRPHLARALVDAGYARDNADAFERLIGNNAPAYLPSARLEVEEAARIVIEAGGLIALAHPLLYRHPLGLDALMPRLKEAGVSGIEVYHTDHDTAGTARLAVMALDLGLWYCGGSDYHGPGRGIARLGGVAVPPGVLDQGPFPTALSR